MPYRARWGGGSLSAFQRRTLIAEKSIATASSPSTIKDVVEYGRSQIAALAHVSTNRAREIHILRLRNSFERADIVTRLLYAMRVLSLMREVQELKGGYWVATPARLVPIERDAILIAPVPTNELVRHFPDIKRAGYARVVTNSDAIDLPVQRLEDWAGLNCANTKSWAAAIVENASNNMSRTVPPENIEYFATPERRFGPRWNSDLRSAATFGDKVVFCRSRLSESRYRFFLGRLDFGRLVYEGPPLQEIDRLQYGLAALAGRPIRVRTEIVGSSELLRFSTSLPRPERRLLLALAVRIGTGPERTYQFHTQSHARLVTERLRALGCEIVKANV